MSLQFYRPRPSGGPLAGGERPSLAMAADALAPEAARAPAIFQPIPFNPKGPSPYRLDLAEVLGDEAVDAIRASNRMIFHTAGDTGGVKSPEAQALVARGMERSFE